MTRPPSEEGARPGEPSPIRPYLAAPPVSQPFQSGPPVGDQQGNTLRPFVLTSGRVDAVDPDVRLETQVTARIHPGGRTPVSRLTPELQAIMVICAEAVSVAEISARLRLHIGVTKILVADLHSAGYVDVHLRDVTRPNSPELILRVIRGLSTIT